MDNFKIICYNTNMGNINGLFTNTIKTIRIGGIPQIWFAHIFSAQTYNGLVDLLPNSIEIFYLKTGNLTCIDKHDASFILKEGSIFINTFDNIKKVQASQFHEHHTFSLLLSPPTESNSFSFTFSQILSDEKICRDVSKYLDLLMVEYKMNGNSLKALSYIFRILEIIDTYSIIVKETDSFGNIRYTNLAKKYIAENIDKKISGNEVAAKVSITPQYLCNIFKKVTGTTIISYINRLKLEKIKNLVINKGISLRQAGESVGIYDENYLSRLFKQYYGKSISELKKYPDWRLRYDKREFLK